MSCDFAKHHFGKFHGDLEKIRIFLDYIAPLIQDKRAGKQYFDDAKAALKRIEEASK